MKKAYSFITFFFLFSILNAQYSTGKKNFISLNPFQLALNGELGVTYDRIISNTKCISVSYGHRFWNFNYVVYGGPEDNTGMGYKYLPQTGDVVKFSFKKAYKENSFFDKFSRYYFGRVGLAYLHTPKFWWRDGSIGESETNITLMSKDKYLGFLGGGWGIQKTSKKMLFDIFLCLAAYAGSAKVHIYSIKEIDGSPLSDLERVYYKASVYPAVEIGLKFGFGL
jgi:hypothetical protein